MTSSDPQRPDGDHDHDHTDSDARFAAMLEEVFGADDPLSTDDCTAMIERLYLFLDEEITEERRALIEQHIQRCTTCGEVFDFELALRMVVRERLSAPVPESLLQGLSLKLREADVTSDGDDPDHPGAE